MAQMGGLGWFRVQGLGLGFGEILGSKEILGFGAREGRATNSEHRAAESLESALGFGGLGFRGLGVWGLGVWGLGFGV